MWVDSLKYSSPMHAMEVVKLNATNSKVGLFWMTTYPLALDMFKKIIGASVGKQIVMFLDYDDMLSPVVDDPDHVFMSDEMRDTMKEVAKYFLTVVISGLCCDKVYNFVREELC